MPVSAAKTEAFDINGEQDFLPVRSEIRRMAKECGLSIVDQTRLVTAASEILRNIIVHAGAGSLQAEIADVRGRPGVKLVFSDRGPGIEDIQSAMQDGFSTIGSLGLGLPGAKRLVKAFDIRSAPGTGTRVEISHFE